MKYCICIILFLFVYSAHGQVDLIAKDNGKYIYDLKIYKCKELGPILEKSEKASMMYQSGINHYKAAKYMFFTGLVTGGLGIYLISASNAFIDETGALLTVGGAVVSVLALLPRIFGDNKIEISVELFNIDMIEKHGYQSNVSLSFEETNNGVGFVLRF